MAPDDELLGAIFAVQDADAAALAANERKQKAREALIALLKVRGTIKAVTGGMTAQIHYQVTVVEAEKLSINEDKLRKALGVRTYNKATVRKLDQRKLKELVQQGVVDAKVVAMASDIVKSAAYPRITEIHDRDL